MKHLSFLFLTAATALAFAGASTAVAQRPAGLTNEVITFQDRDAAEVRDEAKAWEKTPATVPLPEAKKRYQESERQLRDLAEGKAGVFRNDIEVTYPIPARFEVSVLDQRGQVRQAVAEAYDARQQLQAAELAELERRIASIKRAMALRETMKDSIIDQRTDELLEQMEAAKNQPQQQQQRGAPQPNKSGSQSRTPGYPSPAGKTSVDPFGTATGTADDPHIGPEARRQLLELDVQEAQGKVAAAERAYKRGKALFDTGTMGEDAYDKLSEEVERAKIQLERAKVKLKAAGARPSAETRPAATTTREVEVRVPVIIDGRPEERVERLQVVEERKPAEAKPPADNGPFNSINRANTPDPNSDDSAHKRLLELDIEEATEKLDAAQRDYDRVKALHDTGAVEQSVLDQKSKDHEIAKIQLKRAKVKLEAFEKRSKQGNRPAEVPANGSAVEIETNQRLAQLDVEEAEAHLGAAKIQYERSKRLYDSNSIQKSLFDKQADEYKRAQKQLERAKVNLKALSPWTSALDPAQGKQVAAGNANVSLTITLAETSKGKPTAVYLADGKVGEPLSGTREEQDDQIRQAVEQGVSAGKPSVLIKAEKGVAHHDVLRVSEAAGSVEGVSLRLAVAGEGKGRE